MLIAQITDIHLGFQPDDPAELNRKRLDAVLASLVALTPQPDLLLATGDLTEEGTIASYTTLKTVFDALPFPVLPALGNHDVRANFLSVFDTIAPVDGFVQYTTEAGPLRILVLDTLEEGRHGGSFDTTRAMWLDTQLAASARPTLVVLHHPPIETGNGWMTESLDAPWVRTLQSVIERHGHVQRLITGHLHRGMTSGWAGTTVAVCPSSAPQVALDFRCIDPAHPDGRDMVVAEAPGFALHYWTGDSLVTQFGTGGDHPVLARYNVRMQPTVRHIFDERR